MLCCLFIAHTQAHHKSTLTIAILYAVIIDVCTHFRVNLVINILFEYCCALH